MRVDARTGAATLGSVVALGGSDVALLSTADPWTTFLLENRQALSAAYATILQPDNATLTTCLDKAAFAEWCTRFELPCPQSWIPGRSARPASLKFPVLLRPSQTLHGDHDLNLPKAVEARSEQELTHWLDQFASKNVVPLVTESLLGRALEQISVPFARRGSRTLLFSARKIRPPAEMCQVGTCVEMRADERAERLARTVIDHLDYFGIGEIEILRDMRDGSDYLIEVNARPWSQYALAPASNHDFLGFVLKLPTRAEPPVRDGKVWLSLYEDLYIAFSRSVGIVRHGKLGLLAYLRSILRSNVFAIFDWRDLRPFFHSLRRR